MSAVKSLNVQNSSFASLGNIQVQSSPLSSSDVSKKMSLGTSELTTTTPSANSNASETKVHVLDPESGEIKTAVGLSMTSLVSAAKSGVKLITPSATNSVLISNTASKVAIKPLTPVTSTLINSIAIKPSTGIENVTGLSPYKPELISLVRFSPLFDDQAQPTSTNKYVMTRHFITTLTMFNAVSDSKSLSSSTADASNNLLMKTKMVVSSNSTIDKLLSAVKTLTAQTDFLVSAHDQAAELKNRLNLRDTSFPLSRDSIAVSTLYPLFGHDMTLSQAKVSQKIWIDQIGGQSQAMKESFSIVDYLVLCGFDRSNLSVWTSSKIWAQFVYEVGRQLTESGIHTDQVTKCQTVKAKYVIDSDQTIVNKADKYPIPAFSALNTSPLLSEFSMAYLQKYSSKTLIPDFIKSAAQLYTTVDKSVGFVSKNPAKISVLLDSISKEYRYSSMMSDQSFVSAVTAFGTNVNSYTSRQFLFSNIFCSISDDVFSNFTATSTSLSSFVSSQVVDENQKKVIATFEPIQIENVNETTTVVSGGEYYVDSIFDVKGSGFNVDNLKILMDNVTDLYESLSTIVTKGNMLSMDTIKNFTLDINNPSTLIREILDEYIAPDGSVNEKYSYASALAAEEKIVSDGTDIIKQTYVFNSTNESDFISKEINSVDASKIVSVRFIALMAYVHKNPLLKAALFSIVLAHVVANAVSLPLTPGAALVLGGSLSSIVEYVADAIFQGILGDNLQKSTQKTASSALTFSSKTLISTLSNCSMNGSFSKFVIDFMVKQLNNIWSVSNIATGGTVAQPSFGTQQLQIESSGQLFEQNVEFSSRTRYGDISDVSFLAELFDVFCAIAEQTSEVVIASQSNSNFSIPVSEPDPKSSSDNELFPGSAFHTSENKPADTILEPIVVLSVAKSDMSADVASILSAVDHEVSFLRASVAALVGYLSDIKSRARNLFNHLTLPSNIKMINSIITTIGDPKLLKLAVSDNQVRLLYRSIKDLNDRISYVKESDLRGLSSIDEMEDTLLDDAVLSSDQYSMLLASFESKKFRSSYAFNKRILSVGIPVGQVSNLKQTIDASKKNSKGMFSVSERQLDLIRLNVYKIDIEYSDLVFKPISFLFEMSRFVSRFDKDYKKIASSLTFADVINSIPTIDLRDKVITTATPSYGVTEAYSASEYDFLSKEQKTQLVQNHVMSHMLELYVRVLCGIDIDERKFHIIRPELFMSTGMSSLLIDNGIEKSSIPKKTLTIQSKIAYDPSRSMFTNIEPSKLIISNKTVPKKTQSTSSKTINPDNLSQSQQQFLKQSISNVSALGSVITRFSDEAVVTKSLLRPKKFDRVFNVVVDPDDFEIDYDKTVSSPTGKRTLEKLLASEQVIDASLKQLSSIGVNPGNSSAQQSVYKLREKQKSEGDFAFEKYFVTVETSIEEVT